SWTSHRGENQVTLELKINYLRPLTEDESPFKVIGEVLKSGKTTIVTEVRIYGKSGSLLVAALGTWFK
ncbi:MAG: PaaI family thioesterase, partial [Fervidicoccaceae archaeon]